MPRIRIEQLANAYMIASMRLFYPDLANWAGSGRFFDHPCVFQVFLEVCNHSFQGIHSISQLHFSSFSTPLCGCHVLLGKQISDLQRTLAMCPVPIITLASTSFITRQGTHTMSVYNTHKTKTHNPGILVVVPIQTPLLRPNSSQQGLDKKRLGNGLS